MSITYQCEQCSRWETVRDGKVGTTTRCKDCGHSMVVPNTPDLFDDQIDGPAGGGAPSRVRVPIRTTAAAPAPESSGKKSWLWTAGFIAFLLFKLAIRAPNFGPKVRNPRPRFDPPAIVARPDLGNLDGPIVVPASFPDLPPAREIEPGVSLREIKLQPDPARQGPIPPGHRGTLWLYLPTKVDPAPKSLPCVLIAPAGSDGASGMMLAEGDRLEHLPYVRAGFAVMAFDLDGGVVQPDAPNFSSVPAMTAFVKARAGLVNGRIAQAFIDAKVPQVDPGRHYVAGHSSAATFALLFAEHEPGLKGCVAYAPVVDLTSRLGGRGAGRLQRFGLSDLLTRYSPRISEAKLTCPVFLFASRDDENVSFEESVGCSERLQKLKKPVTLELVDTGGHYESMLNEGIPRGIAWLKKRDAEVVKPREDIHR